MRHLPRVMAALLGLAASAVAQNCTTPSAQRTFSNRAEFAASYFFNIGNHFFDLTAQRSIAISSIRTWTFDSGLGFPPVPNQVGATGTVNVYTCPTTRIGNEAISPTTVPTPWTLVGSGIITIVATPGESPIVFNPPLALAAGAYGVALEYLPTTTGPNPGPLHCLGLVPNPNLPVSDQFLTTTNDGIQTVSWASVAVASPNLRIVYTPDAASAHYVSVGEGCYFHPHAWFENFPASATPPDVQNTSQSWVYHGSHYTVVPGAATYVPPTTPSITLGAYGVSSSNSWDDALAVPNMLPFLFHAPGGVATIEITISSNGCLYLANVTNPAYTPFTGASYGAVTAFRDGPPRVAGYFCDLDPTAGGGIHYEADPANQFVRVTWAAVPEWPATAATNTIQITLFTNGNIDLVTGTLSNVSTANGNNAILGYTPGLGSRLPMAIDISAAMPFSSGDGTIPPVLAMDARPVLGTTPNIVTSNISTGTVVQILAAGAALQPVPIDLGIIGMPGCLLTANPFVFLTNVILPNNTFAQPFAIPNDPALHNSQLVFQAAPLTPGHNPASLLLSNGICTRIGQ